MSQLFNTFLYEPILNTLFYLYHVVPGGDFGVAIILVTIIIKLVLFWPSLSALKAQKSLQDTQPQIEEIKRKYKDNKEELGRQLMDFYKKNKVNPFSSCLPMLIQLPILIALYRVFLQGLEVDPQTHLLAAEQVNHLYGSLQTIYQTTPIKTTFLGFVELSKNHNIYLAVLAGLAQYASSKFFSTKKPVVKSAGSKDENITAMMNKQLLYMMPIMAVIFGYQFPAGLSLYWLVTTLFTLVQQLYFFRLKDKWSKKDVINQPPALN